MEKAAGDPLGFVTTGLSHLHSWPREKRRRLLWLFIAAAACTTAARAQFTFVTNNGAITITGYSGPGGAVSIPAVTNGFPVTSIGDGAFSHAGVANVAIPSSITAIGNSAFAYTALTNITVPGSVSNLGNYVFTSCYGLVSATIPGSVPSLGREAFSYCTHLARISLGNGLGSIGTNAFQDCDVLGSMIIPASVTNLAYEALVGCYGLSGIYFAGNPPHLDPYVFYNDVATVYYLPQAAGWGASFGGLPTAVWNPLRILTADPKFGVQTNRFGFNISGSTNQVVVVEACTNLANASWSALQAVTLTGGAGYFSDPQWTNYVRRAYRVRLP